jgi:hypothetical protein
VLGSAGHPLGDGHFFACYSEYRRGVDVSSYEVEVRSAFSEDEQWVLRAVEAMEIPPPNEVAVRPNVLRLRWYVEIDDAAIQGFTDWVKYEVELFGFRPAVAQYIIEGESRLRPVWDSFRAEA